MMTTCHNQYQLMPLSNKLVILQAQGLLQFKHGCCKRSEGGALLTWQPRAARRKVRTVGDMGAAPVTITRTRPPRDSYRRGRRKVYLEQMTSCAVSPERTGTCTLLKMSLSHRLLFLMMPSFTSAYFLSTAKFSSHFLKGV